MNLTMKIMKNFEYFNELYALKNYVKIGSKENFTIELESSIKNYKSLDKVIAKDEDFNIIYGLFDGDSILGMGTLKYNSSGVKVRQKEKEGLRLIDIEPYLEISDVSVFERERGKGYGKKIFRNRFGIPLDFAI